MKQVIFIATAALAMPACSTQPLAVPLQPIAARPSLASLLDDRPPAVSEQVASQLRDQAYREALRLSDAEWGAQSAVHTSGDWSRFFALAEPQAIMVGDEVQTIASVGPDHPLLLQGTRRWTSSVIVSCNAKIAISVGQAVAADGERHDFITGWGNENGRWTWRFDYSGDVPTRRAIPVRPSIYVPDCRGRAELGPPIDVFPRDRVGTFGTPDHTLSAVWRVRGDRRAITVHMWDGTSALAIVVLETPRPATSASPTPGAP